MRAQHTCPWPFCTARVDNDLWGCKRHWYMVPPVLRRALWEAYKPGQSVASASDAYRLASAAIDSWIALRMQTGVADGERNNSARSNSSGAPDPQGELPL